MNKKSHAKICIFSIVVLLISGCALPKPIIKDELPPDAPKGFVAFLPTVAGYSVYLIKDGKEIEEAQTPYAQEYRIAKTPGDYIFMVKHQKFSGQVKVRVLEKKIIYVTIQRQTLSQQTMNYYGVGYQSATTTTTYNVNLSSGNHYIPVNPGPDHVNDLLAALDDDDEGTRLAVMDNLNEICDKNEKMNTQMIADKLKTAYNKERHYFVRYKIKGFLKKISRPVGPSDEDVLVWDGFTDKFIAYSGLEPWLTDDKTYYFLTDGYTIQHDNEGSNWVSRPVKGKLPADFDIELTSTWKSGLNNYLYGLILGNDVKNFFVFGISRGGLATIGLFKDSNHVKNYIPWKQAGSIKTETNRIKLEVRGNSITYYVNDEFVGAISNEESFSYKSYGMIVYNKQTVSFNLLKITKSGVEFQKAGTK